MLIYMPRGGDKTRRADDASEVVGAAAKLRRPAIFLALAARRTAGRRGPVREPVKVFAEIRHLLRIYPVYRDTILSRDCLSEFRTPKCAGRRTRNNFPRAAHKHTRTQTDTRDTHRRVTSGVTTVTVC